ncbi:carbohydrate ABC transporter permease [Ideonella sp. BN130291]|uniref:carbohydrate ABC transporter permease n=1 Tax=Ideonella sp. BN130291 TaxID=3112940 RepID=UPI002E27323C|nr:sugar ABC transporter permease [Ideonella sp. BN130291]
MTRVQVPTVVAAADAPLAVQLPAQGPHTTQAQRVGWLFIAPFLAAYVLLMVWPTVRGVWLSLNAVDLLSNLGRFVAFRNFVDLAEDEIAVRAFLNTLLFAGIATPLLVGTGLALALVLNRPGTLAAWLRGIFFGTSVLSVTVVTLIWRLMLRPETGALASGLQAAGLPMASPLHSPWLALPTVAIMTLWWCVGLPMMLFLAALQQIPNEVYEAADLDNASRWTRFRFITLPALRRVLVLVTITQVIAQLQIFGQVQLLTEGGPNHSTRSLVMFIYEAMFDQWQLGYAAAASQVLTVLLLLCLEVQAKVARADKEGRR